MNIGGSGQSKKIQLVTDLTAEYNKLNQVLQKTKELSADIAANLKAGKGTGAFAVAGGGPNTPQMPGAGTVNGFVQPPNKNQQAASESSSGMSFGSVLSKVLPFVVGGIGLAATALPSPAQAIERNQAEARLNFTGNGRVGARQQISSAMNSGLGIDADDGARAAMRGISAGMLPGYGRNSTLQSAATFSNLAPGIGLEGGMNAAVALNQAASVNKLRMLGIQVRGADGFMRKPEEVANDVYAQMKRAANGKKITKDAIALSLQPGNALGSYLDQYFGGDPGLRMAIGNAIMAKGEGSDLSKESLIQLGLISPLANSIGERNAAASDVVGASNDYQSKGIQEANVLLTKAAKKFTEHVDTFGSIIKQMSKLETLAGGGNGAVGGFLGTAGGLALSGITGLLGGKLGAKGFGNLLKGAGKKIGILALLAALFAGGKYVYDKNKEGDEEDPEGGGVGGGEGLQMSTVNPLAGSPKVSSGYGEVRHLVFNGKKSPSYGKPHGGIDFAVSTGTPVMAAKGGIVQQTGFDADGFGNYVKILHDDGYMSYYGHLSSKNVSGGEVSAGQVIGNSGNSGSSTGPHLHFEVRKGGSSVDPSNYLSGASSLEPGSVNAMSSNAADLGVAGVSLFNMQTSKPLFAQGGGDSGGGSSHTNYGGVVVNINVPRGTAIDEKKLAREVRNILVNEDKIKMAVSR